MPDKVIKQVHKRGLPQSGQTLLLPKLTTNNKGQQRIQTAEVKYGIISGLLAAGKFGSWSVDIEEMTKDDQTLFGVVLTHSMLTLQFSIETISIINDIVNFLVNKNPSHPYKIEGCLGGTLNWIFDEGRLCIRQITEGKLGESELFQVVLNEDEQQDLIEAVKDALDEM